MKKIILNGCSWIAGDEIVWEQFLNHKGLDKNDPAYGWNITSNSSSNFGVLLDEYRKSYRPMFNQRGMLANKLNTEIIDLSEDGNSNDNICMTTINQVLSIHKENRHNYHIIVGWTVRERKLLFISGSTWENIHVNHVEKTSPKWNQLKNRIIGNIVEDTDNDWYLNYFKNVILLESFLKTQNISYTFYRSLGSIDDFYDHNHAGIKDMFKVNLKGVIGNHIRLNNLLPTVIDSNNWLTFGDPQNDQHASIASDSWTQYMIKTFQWQWYIKKDNRHPNLQATKMLVDIIKNHILNNNLLS